MIHLLLPYTSSFAKATNLSYGFKAYDSTNMVLWARIVRAITDTITIVAICRSVTALASEKGGDKAAIYAIVLTVLAYTMPRLLMESTLVKLCEGCPSNGMMSMAIVSLLVILAIEQSIRATL
jgi:hypothetical protein